jgi:hypothetical protein
MIVVGSPALLILAGLSIVGAIALSVMVALLVWFIDVLTVRLVVAGRWRGLRGYEV